MAEHDARPEADVVIEGDPDRYLPACPICQQPGRERASAFSDRQFICAFCGARWIVRRITAMRA
jgi:hypothetical protein